MGDLHRTNPARRNAKILAAGEKPGVVSLPFSPRTTDPLRAFVSRGSGHRGPPIVSLAVPPLPFEEHTLKKPAGEIPGLPVVERPAFSD